jgi:transcription initiation factor IIE alpha subunit
MKPVITASIFFTALLFASCGNNSNEKSNDNATEQTENAMYQCPMKCEGDKMYDKPGQCPVCNMDLVKVEGAHEYHEQDTTKANH